MSAHTPGPWKAEGYYVRQSSQHGTRRVAGICFTGPYRTPPDEYPKSCRLADEANARLIAAAPELLEVLEDIWKFLEESGVDRYYKEAKVIIAKAKGENHE